MGYNIDMSIIQKYRDYLNDNPEGYWFKRKIWGWGWTPARWQGWAVIAVFVAYLVWAEIPFINATKQGALSNDELGMFIARIVIAIVVLIYICYRKGEKPRWMGGFSERG
jgi:hypothetical protein